MPVADSGRREGVHVALTEQDVFAALQLDLRVALRVIERLVTDLDRAHVGPDRDDLGPPQAASDLCCGGDQDSTARPSVAVAVIEAYEEPVMKQLDRH